MREWLARAFNAPRDPAWTADGMISEIWQPISPATGALDAFQWRVPVEATEPHSKELISQKIEELVQLGVGSETILEEVKPENVEQAAIKTITPAKPAETQPTAASSDAKEQTLEAKIIEVDQSKQTTIAKTLANTARKADVQIEKKPSKNRDKPKNNTTKTLEKKTKNKGTNAAKSKPKLASSQADNIDKVAPQVASSNDALQTSTKNQNKTALKPATKAKKSSPSVEAKIFVPPHAPDDPGPGPDTVNEKL